MVAPKKLSSGRWRVLIRRRGFPNYDKTFPTEEEAAAWAAEVERQILRAKLTGRAAEKSRQAEERAPKQTKGVSPLKLSSGKWRVLIRRKGFPTYDQTFSTREAAVEWASAIERHILHVKLGNSHEEAVAALAVARRLEVGGALRIAALTPLPCGNWQVRIRRKGFPRHEKLFSSRDEAVEWATRVEGQITHAEQHSRANLKNGGGAEPKKPRPVKKSEGLWPSQRLEERRKYLEEILAGTRTIQPTTKFKRALIRFGYLREVCVSCNTGPEWAGLPLVLHLDHINGNRTDNRKKNLRLLCPNCHSQTPTYAGRNRKLKGAASKKAVDDDTFMRALSDAGGIREALLALRLSGAGANYERARRLLLKMLQDGTAPDWA